MFETIGRYEHTQFFQRLVGNEQHAEKTIKDLTDVILPLSSRISPDAIGSLLDPTQAGYPRWGDKYENYTYPDPANAEQYAHNRLLQSFEAEKGVTRFEGYEIELAEGRARIAVDAVLLWGRVNAEVECMLQATRDEELAMIATQEFTSGKQRPLTPFHLFEIAIPSLSNTSWHEITVLRRQGGFDSLREKIAEAVEQAAADLNAAKRLFDNLEKNAVDNIFEMARPRVGKIAIEAILTNLPIPVVNPLGIVAGVRDIFQAAKKQKDLGWVYVLRDIRHAAELAKDDQHC